MLTHLFRHVKGKDKKELNRIIAKKREEKTPQEVEAVIGLMKKYGSLSYAERLAEDLAREARIIFQKKMGFLKHQPARKQLETAIEFILKRNY